MYSLHSPNIEPGWTLDISSGDCACTDHSGLEEMNLCQEASV